MHTSIQNSLGSIDEVKPYDILRYNGNNEIVLNTDY